MQCERTCYPAALRHHAPCSPLDEHVPATQDIWVEMAALSADAEAIFLQSLASLQDEALEGLDSYSAEVIAKKLVQSEEVYVKQVLGTIVTQFYKRLAVKDVGIPLDEVHSLFRSIVAIHELNKELLSGFQTAFFADVSLVQVVLIQFQKITPFLKVYAQYISDQTVLYEKLVQAKKSKKFLKFLKTNELAIGVRLSTLLLYPQRRLPQYLIYIGAMSAVMDESSKLYSDLAEVLRNLTTITMRLQRSCKITIPGLWL